MNKFTKAFLTLSLCTFFCQSQIIAIPSRSGQRPSVKTASQLHKKKSNLGSFPTPSGLDSTHSIKEHTFKPTGNKAFDEFRAGIMDNMNNFRKTVLDHYADFLEGEWHEYEPLEGYHRYSQPKPSRMTDAEGNEIEPTKEVSQAKARRSWKDASRLRPVLPEPEALDGFSDSVSTPEIVFDSKETNVWGSLDASTLNQTVSDRKIHNVIKDIEHGAIKMTRDLPGDWLNYFELDVRIPTINFNIADKFDDFSSGSAAQWRALSADSVAQRVNPELLKVARKLNLNDYLIYELVATYINEKFPDSHPLSRASAMHYLLANMDYAIRLAYDPNTDIPYLLLPSAQRIYGHPVIKFNNHEYVFFSPTHDVDYYNDAYYRNWRFLSCGLPLEADNGKEINYNLTGLNLPYSPMKYEIEAGGLRLEGETNETMYPFLANYPQMETECYSMSVVDENIRKGLVEQIRHQLGDKPKLEAVNDLLKFIQYGFGYKTDQEYHGFEKPYFIEENLYYPINDCEDRALLFTYLVWNALGIETQLTAYSDHESASIPASEFGDFSEEYVRRLSTVNPMGYEYEASKMYIADPTLYGGLVGDCMRQYRRLTPKVDKYFH